MKKICLMLIFFMIFSFVGCNKTELEENDMVTEEIKIENEETSFDMAGIESVEEEKMPVGDMFYDLGSVSIDESKDSCFMMPMLQNPEDNSVIVQWFTQEAGGENSLYLYSTMEDYDNDNPLKVYNAKTVKMSRLRGGKTETDKDNPEISCDIYKHIVTVDELPEYHGLIEERRYYRVMTDDVSSNVYSLAARAKKGTPMRILLTSDHQVKKMVAANIQKVYETIGCVDGVLVNGDLVDVSDRAYDWFYANNAFFRCLTGTARDDIDGECYKGAPIIQQAPLYTSIGNHDVMGVYDNKTPLVTQFNEPRTRLQAELKWESLTDKEELNHYEYVVNHSYNTISTEELLENPVSNYGGKKYYGVTLGDIRLITLDVSRVWRLPNIGLGGKYSEVPGFSKNDFSGGEFIFESIKEGSDQIKFLDEELASDEYKDAKIKMVMFHSEAHSLGGNQIPAFTDPVPKEIVSPITGQKMTIYDYPLKDDYIINVLEPRFEKNGTNILFEAHSHLWNRFITDYGMHVIESSNVGNSYGGFDDDKLREQAPSAFDKSDQYHKLAGEWDENNYKLNGDPNGLTPVMPNIASLPDNKPFLDSNTITAFSILDTGKGTIDSYYFDIENKEAGVVLFDSFSIF